MARLRSPYVWIILFGFISNVLSQTPGQPSVAQASSALVAGGAGIGNSPLATALQQLVQSGSTLTQVVSEGFSGLLQGINYLFNPELQYSYGGSPPFYPTPEAPGDGQWAAAYSKARALVSQMTDEEKNNITYGVSATNGCSGFTGSAPRLGFPGICLNDAESGVRTGKLVSGYPAQLHIGASWNRSLARDRGYHVGREFKAKGINVALGPVIGPLGRLAKGGRNWEGFSNDPYLAGELVGPTVEAMQQSVIACAKHFIAYEQETNRLPFLGGVISGLLTQSVSSNLDDKTMHESYLWPFYDAVKAGVGSIMASYQRINNSYASQNSKTMNGLLKTELGFEGFVVSDWLGQRTGIASANAGLDMAMPNSMYWNNNNLAKAASNGSLTASRLDDMATRILASWYRFADFEEPGMKDSVDARDPAAEPTLFQGAVEGHVLVKNIKNALPLKKPQALSLFGYDAMGGLNKSSDDSLAYPFALTNTPNYTNSFPFNGLQALIFYTEVAPYGSAGPEVALGGTMITGAGSGAVTPASSFAPYDGFVLQAAADGTKLYTNFYSQNPKVTSPSDACIVFVNEQSSESWDRPGLADPYTDKLIGNVASQCNNTMVVMHNAGVRLVDNWIDHPNITAVIIGHLPGQDSGIALTEIMYGRQSPSGRLPYTVAKNESDYGALLNPASPTLKTPIFPQSDFAEGNLIDYKAFISHGITPRFPFGFGLTYTTFNYSGLQITKNSSANTAATPPDAANASASASASASANTTTTSSSTVAPEGGLRSLYDVVATVSATVSNTGPAPAAEVAQLYLGIPNGLPKVLRGFDKQVIQPGKSASVTFPLRRRDLSTWDVARQQWILQAGSYTVMVGKSVLDIQLQGTLSM